MFDLLLTSISIYRVELKSIKIVDSSSTQPPLLNDINYDTKVTDSSTYHSFKIIPGVLNDKYYTDKNKHKKNNQFNDIKHVKSINNLNVEKVNPDYDVYYKNELKVSNACDKDKVQIFLEKHKRKIRNVLNDYTVPSICDLIFQ